MEELVYYNKNNKAEEERVDTSNPAKTNPDPPTAPPTENAPTKKIKVDKSVHKGKRKSEPMRASGRHGTRGGRRRGHYTAKFGKNGWGWAMGLTPKAEASV